MKVQNMTSSRGNKIPNQFIITDGNVEVFQSYSTIVIKREHSNFTGNNTYIDKGYPFSVTTSKYANRFLNLTSKEIKAKIKSGEFILTDLNK